MMVFGVIVMWAMVAALVICAALWPLARHADRRGRPGLLHGALTRLRQLTLSTLLALGIVFIGSVAHSGKSTNSPPAGIMMPLLPHSTGGTTVHPVVITQEEIAQGWRLESVTTNDAVSYAMPTNGVEYVPWSLGGGYEAHFPLGLGDFAFPFGTGVVHRLDVLSGGMVESLPRQRVESACYTSMMSICAAREWASIVPGVGRFWWADEAAARPEAAPYRVKLLTWENVYGERDRTGQYSAQIELREDGNFTTRSNNVESVYRRVHPHDLDNDGLPNIIDPAPEVPIVPSAWNQSEAWAEAAFPSNVAEMASAGGYASWAAAMGADPDRRLVSFGITFDDGSTWPALLDFDGIPVMVDGREDLAFAIDCGAKVPFSLTAGRLASLAVTATEPPMRSGEGLSTTDSSEIQGISDYPHERMVGDVKLHLDGPRSGWLCRFAGVSIAPDSLSHIYPCGSVDLEAALSCCHSNAYLGCSWYGGAGITFSQEHSLSTEATYDPSDPEDWTTNIISLVTQFVGYTLTNHLHVTVGITNVPPLRFSLGCQEVFFLNDADFLDVACPSNRPERIRPVTLNLTGPVGTNGTVTLSVEGGANPVVFHVVNGATNLVTASTEIPLAVTNDVSYTGSYTIYVSCPNLGTGTITATFTPSGDNAEPLTAYATFRCIEPLRKLVTTEKFAERYVNPSRLVMGTNAVLKVSANGPFSSSEVDWRLVSGSAQLVSDGWHATVTPTGLGTVIVEARFNDDEIQPRFVLPVVQLRTIPVRAFVIEPPVHLIEKAWEDHDIVSHIDKANEIFSQIGVQFRLDGILHNVGTSNDWDLCIYEDRNFGTKWGEILIEDHTEQYERLVNVYTNRDCIKIFYVGTLRKSSKIQYDGIFAEWKAEGILMPKGMLEETLAHELGHALRLSDIYLNNWYGVSEQPTRRVDLAEQGFPLEKRFFGDFDHDWGRETGRGFYELNDTLGTTLKKFLMFGVYLDLDNVGCDIPSDTVHGIPAGATTQGDARQITIGARETERHANEVYSR